MAEHILDRPARAALATRHRAFVQSSGDFYRYDPGIAPFAVIEGPDHAPLAEIIAPGEAIAFLQKDPVEQPPGFSVLKLTEAVQMIGHAGMTAPDDPEIVQMTPADIDDMLALAQAVQPGPFSARVLEIGRFWGVRRSGRLVAMAGERIAIDGYVEVSGVSVAEEARGLGLARRLSRHVAGTIVAQGDMPFLHAVATNVPAITLYRDLGFETRSAFSISAFLREG